MLVAVLLLNEKCGMLCGRAAHMARCQDDSLTLLTFNLALKSAAAMLRLMATPSGAGPELVSAVHN